jgi:transposase
MTMAYPEWVEAQKRQGCEIKRIGDKYYLYERKSQWDANKKKAKKKTGEYLGAITPEGFKPKKTTLPRDFVRSVKEYGASAYLCSLSGDIREILCREFPEDRIGETIYALAVLRVMGEASFKRMEINYETSFLSESMPGLLTSGSKVTGLLEHVGRMRDRIVLTMNAMSESVRNIIVDGSSITSRSQLMTMPEKGRNNRKNWDPQVNVIYVFERAALPQPVFYRCVRGNIADVSAMKLTMESMERECFFTLVADAGFASDTNFALMEESGLEYIVPLKRNTKEVSGEELGVRGKFKTAFTYNKRSVLAHEPEKDGYRIIVYRDESMRSKEMSDFIGRLEKKNAAIEESKRKKDAVKADIGKETMENDPYFGTIIIRTNMQGSVKEIYETYKLRVIIEQCFDTLKNTLAQDHSYMHSDTAFEAWCFINHIALTIAYRVLNSLKEKNLTNRYSLKDIMVYLSKIQKIKIGGSWTTAEFTKNTRIVCEKLDLAIV